MVVSRATSGFFVFGVLASLVAGLDRNPNYADEASEIKNMMESVRVQTEGGATKKACCGAASRISASRAAA